MPWRPSNISSRKRIVRARQRRSTLRGEPLEDRRQLTVLTVNTNLDSFDGVCDESSCSIRDALDDAATGDSILFSFPDDATIMLTMGPVDVEDGVDIDGMNLLAGEPVRLQQTGPARVMNVDNGVGEGTGVLNVRLANLVIAGGNDPGGVGGGIRNRETLTLDRVTVVGNQANLGGGIHNDQATLTINNSTITGNVAVSGGGIYNDGLTASLNVYNSTISGNQSLGFRGGGMVLSGVSTIDFTTIVNNQAVTGGGIYLSNLTNAVSLSHTIVATNFAVSGPDLSNNPSVAINATFNFVGRNDGTGLAESPGPNTPDVMGNLIGGPVNGAINPSLGGLFPNGGLTRTHLPDPGSPVIDRGGGSRVTDQRGLPGVSGARVEMGSVEFQRTPLLPEPGNVVYGLSHAGSNETMELIRGPASTEAAAAIPDIWNSTSSIQSVEFDNFQGIEHNAHGNLLGVTFGQLGTGGRIYNFSTTDGANGTGQLLFDFMAPGHLLTTTRLTGLSVSPLNNRIAVVGRDTGTVIVFDYTPGDTMGHAAVLNNGRETALNTLIPAGAGTTWLDNNTVLGFSANGTLFAIDASPPAGPLPATIVANVGMAFTGEQFTSLAYHPGLSRHLYAIYSGSASGLTTNTLYVFDPTQAYAVVRQIDLSSSASPLREIAIGPNAALFLGQFGGSTAPGARIDILPAAGAPQLLLDNSSLDWYIPKHSLISDLNGLDVGLSADPDFNNNGSVGCDDVDALVAAIVAATHQPLYDLTVDGFVDAADLARWLQRSGNLNLGLGRAYAFGDANLDGTVDRSDFAIWYANRFTSLAAWCSGDFNADGGIDGSDFDIWNANKVPSTSAPGGSVSGFSLNTSSLDRVTLAMVAPTSIRPVEPHVWVKPASNRFDSPVAASQPWYSPALGWPKYFPTLLKAGERRPVTNRMDGTWFESAPQRRGWVTIDNILQNLDETRQVVRRTNDHAGSMVPSVRSMM